MAAGRPGTLLVVAALAVSCNAGQSEATTPSSSVSEDNTTTTSASQSFADLGERRFVTSIPGAVAVGLAVGSGQPPLLAWTTPESVVLAELEPDSGELGDPAQVSPAPHPFAHPIERPAVGRRPNGTIDLAFTALVSSDGSVYYVSANGIDRIAGATPRVISGDPRPETNLVHLSYHDDGSPLLAWLESATLSVADGDGSPQETELVDELTCDCCNPAPIAIGDTTLVAYRDFEDVGGQVARDTAVIRSDDGLATFDEPIRIADDHWFISGCPFSGPSAVSVGTSLIVAWMDARQSAHADQSSSTIWVDRSTDGGESFGKDMALTDGGLHRWPVMAVDGEGGVHIVWETQGPDGGLSYAHSKDGGLTFSDPTVIVDRSDSGTARSPSVAIQDEMLLVTWTDAEQGYVAAWALKS